MSCPCVACFPLYILLLLIYSCLWLFMLKHCHLGNSGGKNLTILVSKLHISWCWCKHKHFSLYLLGFECTGTQSISCSLSNGASGRCSINVQWINEVTEQESESSVWSHCSVHLFGLKLRVMPTGMGRERGCQRARTRSRRGRVGYPGWGRRQCWEHEVLIGIPHRREKGCGCG